MWGVEGSGGGRLIGAYAALSCISRSGWYSVIFCVSIHMLKTNHPMHAIPTIHHYNSHHYSTDGNGGSE